MEMYLKTHSSSVCIWIFLALLHRVTSTHGQQTLTMFHQNAEEENLKVKVKKSMEAENDRKLQDVNSCACRDYCPDPNSTELQVSFLWKFYDKLLLFRYDYSYKHSSHLNAPQLSAYLHIVFDFIFP